MEELKPCPFCGCKKIRVFTNEFQVGENCYVNEVVSCTDCGGRFLASQGKRDYAVKMWNTRNRHIDIEVLSVDGRDVKFIISNQTHRCSEFSRQNSPNMFISKNGCCLLSESNPSKSMLFNALYVQGELKEFDSNKISVDVIQFAKIMEAISEYNKTDGIGYKNIWPLKGEKYFYINSYLEIKNKIFSDDETDEKLKSVANLFRTEEEAKEHIEKIKNIFNRTENNI